MQIVQKAIRTHVDNEDKVVNETVTTGGIQKLNTKMVLSLITERRIDLVVDLNEYKCDRQLKIGTIVECIVNDWKGLKGVITSINGDTIHIKFGKVDFVTCKEDFKNVFKFI